MGWLCEAMCVGGTQGLFCGEVLKKALLPAIRRFFCGGVNRADLLLLQSHKKEMIK